MGFHVNMEHGQDQGRSTITGRRRHCSGMVVPGVTTTTTVMMKMIVCLLVCSSRVELCQANTVAGGGGGGGAGHSWEAPGCHLVGHTRVVKIPDCVPFQMTTNACRGFCVSFAIPSPYRTLSYNPSHIITSRAECCDIIDTHDIPVQVRCVDGVKEIVFKSAKSCACSICRRE
ncbi:thyrostimulin alpha-2 subunit-like [Babylonia areolata]|uniref:thyrostimulin alpha-2 subunit-like n=1 Tax=Babylonia areolata TaxID=304850 RepID=UPI003FD5B616